MDYTETFAQKESEKEPVKSKVINEFTCKIGITESGNVKMYTAYKKTDQLPDLMPADIPDEDVQYFTGCLTVKKVRVIIEELD